MGRGGSQPSSSAKGGGGAGSGLGEGKGGGGGKGRSAVDESQLEEDLAVSELREALSELPAMLREEPESLCDAMDFAVEYVDAMPFLLV